MIVWSSNKSQKVFVFLLIFIFQFTFEFWFNKFLFNFWFLPKNWMCLRIFRVLHHHRWHHQLVLMKIWINNNSNNNKVKYANVYKLFIIRWWFINFESNYCSPLCSDRNLPRNTCNLRLKSKILFKSCYNYNFKPSMTNNSKMFLKLYEMKTIVNSNVDEWKMSF